MQCCLVRNGRGMRLCKKRHELHRLHELIVILKGTIIRVIGAIRVQLITF